MLCYLDDWLVLAHSHQEAIQARDEVLLLFFSTRNCGEQGKILSVSISDSHLSRDGLNKSVFKGFPDGETSRRSLETDRRIFILQEAKHRYLEISAGSPVVPVSSSSNGSSKNAIPTTSTLTELGFCGRGILGSVELSNKIGPSVAVRRSAPSGRGVSSDSPTRPALLVRHLGSGLGGAHLLDHFASGLWSQEERLLSINFRELRAIRRGLQEFQHLVEGLAIGGQHYSFGLCEKTGKNDLRGSDSSSLDGVTQCHSSTSVCDGIPRCGSGFVKPQESSDRVRMDTSSGSSGQASTTAGERGSVRNFSELSDSSLFQEYEETCLFIKHESLQGDSPRVYPNILKCSLHSLVARVSPLVGFATRAMMRESSTHCLILNSLAFARGCVILRSRFLISPFAFYSYISSYSPLILIYSVILLLCDHRVRILQQCLVDAGR